MYILYHFSGIIWGLWDPDKSSLFTNNNFFKQFSPVVFIHIGLKPDTITKYLY